MIPEYVARERVAPLTVMPTGVLVRVFVAVPDAKVDAAVMLVAPAELMLAAFRVMVATPPAFVRAVAETGVKTTRPLAAAKETTAPDTASPSSFLNVAVAVTGVPKETVPDERVKVRELWSVVVVLEPESSPVVSLLPQAMTNKASKRQISSPNDRENFDPVDFNISFSLLNREWLIFDVQKFFSRNACGFQYFFYLWKILFISAFSAGNYP